MNILVCVKQVPDTMEIKIDPETNTLLRNGVPSIANPYDICALELAVRCKKEHGASVTVLTMGPEQAKAVLKECLSLGADHAYLVSDRLFGGSDTLATSYILSTAIRRLEQEHGVYDLILCGKQAIDGDTAQVGPEIAEELGRPQITYAADLTLAGEEIHVKRETDDGYDIIGAKLPALATVIKTNFPPLVPTMKSKLAANRAVIPVITSNDLEIDPARCGLKGSPTKGRKTFVPPRGKKTIKISGENPEEAARQLVEAFRQAQVL